MDRSTPQGEGSHDMKVMHLRKEVRRGKYRVDERAVAEAIVRRLLGRTRRRATPSGDPPG
jgi:anti-sigma28 factor (negative regulator of flagellin synthesis)